MAADKPTGDRTLVGQGRETSLTVPSYGYTGDGFGGFGGVWMGPGQPLRPVAPPDVEGRRFDYPVGINYTPRRSRAPGVTFEDLRGLADGYDLLRLVIETRKDQLERLKWNIKPRDPKAKVTPEMQARIKAIEEFMLRPDRKQWWGAWLRALLEDLFVLDAPTIYRRRTRGGSLYALELIDGATIDCLVDAGGRTPEYPDPAYQQRLKGLPAVDYTDQDLLYRPRNRRNHKVYGYGPVEQVIMTVNIALRRQLFQLAYFTEGNVPEALVGVPETWTPEQIGSFQASFDSLFAGNAAMRRRMHFIPSSAAKGYTPTKSDQVFGEAEEWLARVVCFAFSISPLPFIRMMNRATSNTSADQATEEGLLPLMGWVKGLIDEVVFDDFNSPDLEFAWAEETELSPKDQSEMLSDEADGGKITFNEMRELKGLDPYPDPAFNKPMIKTATGLVFASPVDAMEDAKLRQKELGPPPGAEGPEGAPGPKSSSGVGDKGPAGGQGAGAGAGDDGGAGKAAAASAPALKAAGEGEPDLPDGSPAMSRPLVRRAIVRLTRTITAALTDASDDVAGQIEGALRQVMKAAGDEEIDLDALLADLDLDAFDVLIDEAQTDFDVVAADAARMSLAQIGVDASEDLFSTVNERARVFAEDRAAELVGRRRLADGTLVDSPNPEIAISEATRRMLRETIETGIAENLSVPEIADRIQNSAAFGADRAKLIARTEIRKANSKGALIGYLAARSAGVSVKKKWLEGPASCMICRANADQGAIELEQPFQSGDQEPGAHPRCTCALSPVIEDDDQTSAGGA